MYITFHKTTKNWNENPLTNTTSNEKKTANRL